MDTKTLEKRIAAALKEPQIGPYELANLLRAENSRANKACRLLEQALARLDADMAVHGTVETGRLVKQI